LVFARLQRRYLEHLALALNVLTFYLLCNAIGQVLILAIYRGDARDAEGLLQTGLALIVLPSYWFFSTKRFYGIRPFWALLSSVVMTVGNAILALAINIIAYAVLLITA